ALRAGNHERNRRCGGKISVHVLGPPSGKTYAASMTVLRRLARGRLAARGRRTTRPAVHPRRDPRRPEGLVLHVLERDGHHLACASDLHLAEELQPETGRKVIALFAAASFLEHRARAKSVVERLRVPGAGMDRTGNELQNGSKSWNTAVLGS